MWCPQLLSFFGWTSKNEGFFDKITNKKIITKSMHLNLTLCHGNVWLRWVSQHFLCSYNQKPSHNKLAAQDRRLDPRQRHSFRWFRNIKIHESHSKTTVNARSLNFCNRGNIGSSTTRSNDPYQGLFERTFTLAFTNSSPECVPRVHWFHGQIHQKRRHHRSSSQLFEVKPSHSFCLFLARPRRPAPHPHFLLKN